MSQPKIKIYLTGLNYNFSNLQQFTQATYIYARFIYKFIVNYYKLLQVAANCDLSQLSQLSKPQFSLTITITDTYSLYYRVYKLG